VSTAAWALAAGLTCPTGLPGSDVTVEVVTTAIISAQWPMVVNNGRKGPVELPVLVGVIEHQGGAVLVDAGLGNATREGTFPRFPLRSGMSVRMPPGATIAERLDAPPRLVLMTHLHYDHVGGLLDLPGASVWTTEAEWHTTMTSNLGFPEARMKDAVDWQVVPLREGRVQSALGRPAIDVMGDGSIWYISTPGHTPGSASVLVRAEDGPWLFIGDIAWVDDHLQDAQRPWWVSLVVDGRPRQLRKSTEWVRTLQESCPDLRIVAGHEPRWTALPPELPANVPLR